MIEVNFDRALHGLAKAIRVNDEARVYGYVQRASDGLWAQKVRLEEPWIEGYRTRADATVAVLLRWSGQGSSPKASDIYKWILRQNNG